MGGKSTKPVAASAPAKEGQQDEQSSRRGCCGGSGGDPEWGMMPPSKRKCRDVFCCLFFVVFWIGMLIIGGIGIKYGKPERLVYGTDYKGQVCGSDTSVKDSKYVTYPRTNEDYIANLGKSNPLDYKFYGVCVPSCPVALDVICNYDVATDANIYTPQIKRDCIAIPNYAPNNSASCSVVQGGCWITPQTTASTLFRCIPTYNVTGSSAQSCVYPPGITSPYDPQCIIVQDDSYGSVQHPAKPNLLFDQLNTGRALWGRWFGDLARTWWVVLACSIGVALVLGFTWVTLLKYCTGCMVWTTIFLVLSLLSFLTGYFYYKAGLVQFQLNIDVPPALADEVARIQAAGQSVVNGVDAVASTASGFVPQSWNWDAAQYQKAYSAMAYISTIVTLIVLCITIAMRKSISMAIDVIRIGTDALKALPGLLFFPCTNVLAIGVFLVWWLFVAACLQSAGTITTEDLSKDVQAGAVALNAQLVASGVNAQLAANATAALLANYGGLNSTYTAVADMPVMNYLIIYHIFGLLWTTSFIQGVGSMTVAGAVAAWYFSQLPKDHEGVESYEKLRYNKGRFPICGSLGRTLRYYLGSVAFGSLLIAFIQAVRLAMAYIQKKLEPQAKNNSSLRFMLCCIQCCLKCLQTMIEVVTRNAFVFVALKGGSFCASGGLVFKLIVSHGSVFAAVNVLGEIIMFLGKLVISIGCAWIAYVLLDTLPQFQPGGKDALSSTWLPILCTLFFSYATASGFMMIFDLSVDTVLICYCTDVDENKQRNGGSSKFAFALHMHPDRINASKAHSERKGKGSGGGGKGDAQDLELTDITANNNNNNNSSGTPTGGKTNKVVVVAPASAGTRGGVQSGAAPSM